MSIWYDAAAYLGIAVAATWALGTLKTIFRFATACHSNNLFERYGKKGESWVVVTGGSDGIGLEICHQLAAQGANICIVGRNPEKIQGKLNELKERFPQV